MPIGTTSYARGRSPEHAAGGDAEMACSLERPPKTTATRGLPGPRAIGGGCVVAHGALDTTLLRLAAWPTTRRPTPAPAAPATPGGHRRPPPHEPDEPLNAPVTLASTYVAGGDVSTAATPTRPGPPWRRRSARSRAVAAWRSPPASPRSPPSSTSSAPTPSSRCAPDHAPTSAQTIGTARAAPHQPLVYMMFPRLDAGGRRRRHCRAAERQHLPLAAGERLRLLPPALGEARKTVIDFLQALIGAVAAARIGAEQQIVGDRHVAEQFARLRHQAEAALDALLDVEPVDSRGRHR